MALAPRFIERLDWPADRLALHREQRLRDLARHAITHSLWHRDRLADVDPARLDELSLRELPPMTKSDLMENFDQIVTDERLSLRVLRDHLRTVSTGSYLFGEYTAVTSGGSTGERGVFVYDWEGWTTFWLSVFRYLQRSKRKQPGFAHRPVVRAWVTAAHFSHVTAALSRTFASPDLVNARFPVTLPIEQMVAGLNAAQPDRLVAYQSAVHVLSIEAQRGTLGITPRRVLSTAEPLLPEIRAAAEQAWGVRVGNVWGTSEGGIVAGPCDDSGSHLSDDLLIVEAVDEDGRTVAPGERSAKVYVTNLFNRSLPLIRYEITDEVTIVTEPCACGSAHRCVAGMRGRLDDVLVYGRRRVHPHVFRSALSRHAGVIEDQVRQTPQGASIIVRCGAPVELERVRAQLADALAGAGLTRPTVDVTAVERLDRDPAPAKPKRFVPLEDRRHGGQGTEFPDRIGTMAPRDATAFARDGRVSWASTSTTRAAAAPSQPGMVAGGGFSRALDMRSGSDPIRSGASPSSTLVPDVTVTGRSVFSRSVKQGILR
jgi:phenylacetate-CoA ligase